MFGRRQERRTGPTRRGLRRSGVVAIASLALAGLYALPAEAVHDDGYFELEGNTVQEATAGDDWQNLYNAGTNKVQGTPDSDLPTCSAAVTTNCFSQFSFTPDPAVGDQSYYTQGGSKDRNDVSAWRYTANDQSPDKNDITNAFAASYRNEQGKLQLYFGSDRFAVNGDAQMGFWFFQSQVCLAGQTNDGVVCPNTNPGQFVDPTTGDPAHHQNGDVLALVNFNNGGTIGLAGVYVWAGDDPNTAAVEGEPTQAIFGPGADCKTIDDEDDFCTTVNTENLTSEPFWPYSRKGGGSSYLTSAFIEGGVDLGAVQGAGTCFASFLSETRSSSGPSSGLSLDAQLKDLTLDTFQSCGSSLTTTPKTGAGADIPAGGLSIGTGSVTARDFADLDVTGTSTWSGNLKFFLCKTADTTATCSTGGTQIGPLAGVTVNQDSPESAFLSDAATITSAANGTAGAPGRYCWRGVFTSATQGVPSQTDSRATECFIVNPVTPTLSTQAVDGDGNNITAPVPFGQKIYDKATLTGTANQPGTPVINPTTAGGPADGTITFKLYGPTATATAPADPAAYDAACATLATGFPAAGIAVTVSGDGTYGGPTSTPAVEFTPQAPGFYHWKATYGGDDPNTLGASHNANCGQAAERVEIQRLQPTMTTAQQFVPNDSATVTVGSGAGNLAGSVVFKLYVNDSDCSEAAAYTSSAIDITTGTGTGLSRTVVSGNTTAYSTTGTTFHWVVAYTSTNAAHTSVTSGCGNEHSSITINNGVQQPAST